MKIRTLVLSYCASAVALPLAIGVVSWVVQNRMFDATEEIARTTSSVRQVMLADMMHDGLRSNVMYALHQASVGNKKNVADETKEIERSAQTFRGAILSLKSSAQTEDILRMSNETLPVLETYIEAARKLGAQALAGNHHARLDEFQSAFEALEVKLDKLGDTIESRATDSVQAAAQARTSAQRIEMIVVIATAILAAIGALVLVRRIINPLRTATDVARKIGEGDLTTAVPVHYRDEAGEMLEAIDSMRQSLSDVVRRVRGSSDMLVNASAAMEADSKLLSDRTEELVAGLQQTSSTVDEFTATIEAASDTAQSANSAAQSASDTAQRGNDDIGALVSRMHGMGQSAKQIQSIVRIIDHIAFQTNILALNAAVEAARAGEYGRSFSVVASSVRVLAQRSAAAAKDIRSLIIESVAQIEEGVRLTDSTGETMSMLLGSVNELCGQMNKIASSARSQQDELLQVGTAIGRMNGVVLQNASFASQTLDATKHLRDQARQLSETVERFTVPA